MSAALEAARAHVAGLKTAQGRIEVERQRLRESVASELELVRNRIRQSRDSATHRELVLMRGRLQQLARQLRA